MKTKKQTKLQSTSWWRELGTTCIMSLCCIITFASETVYFDKVFKEALNIEQQIKRTSFPDKVYNIKDFGAKTNTPEEPCHEEINLAITTCNQAGG